GQLPTVSFRLPVAALRRAGGPVRLPGRLVRRRRLPWARAGDGTGPARPRPVPGWHRRPGARPGTGRGGQRHGPQPRAGGRGLGQVFGFLTAWLWSWQHPTIPKRVAFLRRVAEDPAVERRFQRRVALVKWGVVVGLVGALLAVGLIWGWDVLRPTS